MKSTLIITSAIIAGFIGGVTAEVVVHAYEGARVEDVVRAHSFALVDRTGHAISYWGIDNGKNIVLAFGRPTIEGRTPMSGNSDPKIPADQMEAIGLQANSMPILTMNAGERKPRISMYLSLWGKPVLLMEDDTGPRLALGVDQSDTPGPEDNNWFLTFEPDRARIGMYTEELDGETYVRGGFGIRQDRVKYPYLQPK